MKTPLSWISLYTPLQSLIAKQSMKELAHEYSIHTAEIDGIEEHFLDKVVVGKVLSCEKHPESKKLSIVRVYLGEHGEETILTGAANIVDATYVAVATVGAVLPGDFTIGERMMAGMMSRGMICSDDELWLATERSEGIMNLEEHWDRETLESMLGKSFFDLTLPFVGMNGTVYYFSLRDATFEIDNKFITNRPDLFSVYGNAREWHAIFDIPFTEYSSNQQLATNSQFPITIETDKVLSYHARKMEWVSVRKSPFGMSVMMERSGLTPKMDIVDITNCILTEFGQPMHAFDADKINWGIVIRMAKEGEKLLALNGVEYVLTPDDMVIADHEKPIALAGIIGGMESAVTESSTNIIWESACFDAVNIRLSAQRHGIRTDASTRYEKSLDPLLAEFALPRITDYTNFLWKTGTITSSASYVDISQINHITLDIPYDFINMKAGATIPREEVHDILTRLWFTITTSDTSFTVQVPSWRSSKDISIKEDIAEEVVRIYWYDQIPLTPINANLFINKKNPEKSLKDTTLWFWSRRWWNEVYNYSFTSIALDKGINMVDMDNAVGIKNAFNEDYTHMRRSLANRLLEDIANNTKYSDTLKFFEIGKVYTKDGETGKIATRLLSSQESQPFPEKKMLAGIMTGGDITALRNDLENFLMEILGYVPPLHNNTHTLPFLHPGIAGEYRDGEIIIARFGQIHPLCREAYGVPLDTLYFEVEYETILELHADKEVLFHPISRYQTITRELNFVMSEKIETGPMAHLIDALHPWIANVVVDSIYRDPSKIGAGKKSVNFSFTLTNMDDTISDEDALTVQNSIITKMQEHGLELRQ